MGPSGRRRQAGAARGAWLVALLLVAGATTAAAGFLQTADHAELAASDSGLPANAADAAAAASGSSGSGSSGGGGDSGSGGDAAAPPDPDAEAVARLARGEKVKMMVVFKVTDDDVRSQERGAALEVASAAAAAGAGAGARAAAASPAARAAAVGRVARVRAHAAVKSRVLGAPAAAGAAAAGARSSSTSSGAGAGVRVARDYDQLPVTLVEVDSLADYEALTSDPRVAGVGAVRYAEPALAQSLPAIFQPEAAELLGGRGDGCTIVVLDQGADYRVADLGSCASPGAPPPCRVSYAADLAADDGRLDDASRHGTNVASIAARTAPGAKITVLDIFNGNLAASADIVAGINWAVANKDARNVCAINLSIGDSYSYNDRNPCPADAVVAAIAEARRAGVPAAVAAGNKGYKTGVAWPACAPEAIAVGATYDSPSSGLFSCTDEVTLADMPACFSNAGPGLDVLAPGANITAGGATISGTSMASPHVAGALAVLRAAAPGAGIDELEAALKATGAPTPDPRSGPPLLVYPRLNLAAALARVTGREAELRAADAAPPAARVRVNFDPRTKPVASGTWSLSRQVSIQTYARDLTGVDQMCIAEKGTPAAAACAAGAGFVAFAPSAAFVLSEGDANKTVQVWLRDRAGNLGPSEAAVALDGAPPASAVRVAGPAVTKDRLVTLTLTGSDGVAPPGSLQSCVASYPEGCFYDFQFKPGFVSGANASFSIDYRQGLQTIYFFLKDPAGNVGRSQTDITYDSAAPTGASIVINGGGAATSNPRVSLALTAADATSGVDRMCITQQGAGAAPLCAPFRSAVEFDLTGGDGAKTLSFQVWDVAGNSLSRPPTASITLDTSPPANARVSVAGAGAPGWLASPAVTLSIAADDASGIQDVCVTNSAAVASAPGACQPFVAYAPALPWTLDAGDGPKTVYVLLRDRAGLVTPAPATAAVNVDATPPAGAALVINGGAARTARAAVTLSVSGSDAASGVSSMCLSNADVSGAPGGCAPFVPYEASYAWALDAAQDGPKAVWLVLRDAAGNAAPAASAAITLDRSAPGGAAAAINGGALWTRERDVRVEVSAKDPSALAGAQMCVQNGPAAAGAACAPFVPFAPALNWTLPPGDGRKAVLLTIRTAAGEAAEPIAAEITLDTAPPAASVTVTPAAGGGGQVTLKVTASDAGSGVAGMCITDTALSSAAAAAGYAGAAVAPGACGPPAAFAAFAPSVALKLAAGEGERRIGVVLSDRAGNVMAAPAEAAVTLDLLPPSGAQVIIGSGAAVTAKRSVQITLSAADASGVTSACVTQDAAATAAACKPWRSFSRQQRRGVRLSGGDGAKTVRAFFRDGGGRVTEAPAVASVVLDATPPAMPPDAAGMRLATAPAGATALDVTWDAAAASDGAAGSGLATYALAWRQGNGGQFPSPRCRGRGSGEYLEVPASEGRAAITGLEPGKGAKLRLCAVDKAGNRAQGVKIEAQLAP